MSFIICTLGEVGWGYVDWIGRLRIGIGGELL
jgi:hypothetical protein